MNVTYRKGATCDFCQRAIGDIGNEISAIYKLESWHTPGRHIQLCSKDLDLYHEFIRQERESLAAIVADIGMDALTERQKLQYKELH